MIEILAAHKRELESELRARVQAFFEANAEEAPESISIEMKLTELEQGDSLSTIHILVKDTCTRPSVPRN